MKNLFIIFIVLELFINFFHSTSTAAQGFDLNWAKRIGNTTNDQLTRIDTDSIGNVYVIGYFLGTVDFDPGPSISNLTAQNTAKGDMYILKIDANGMFSWVKKINLNPTSTTPSIIGNIKINGNSVYVTGAFLGTTDFDPGANTFNLTRNGTSLYDIFLLKLDLNGNFIWAQNYGGTLNDIGRNIAFDSNNNILLIGYFNGTSDFNYSAGTNQLTSSGAADVFLLKLSPNGAFQWVKKFGGSADDDFVFLELDDLNNIYIGGQYESTNFDIDPGASAYLLTNSGLNDMGFGKLDPNGNFLWGGKIGNANDNSAFLTFNKYANQVLLYGNLTGTLDLNPGTGTNNVTSLGQSDIFITALNSSGSFSWSKIIASSGNEGANGINIDNSGNLLINGVFEQTLDLDPSSNVFNLSTNGSRDIFLCWLSPSGNFIDAIKIGGTGFDNIYILGSTILNDDIYLSGLFSNSVDFDPSNNTNTLTSLGLNDIFITKYNKKHNNIRGKVFLDINQNCVVNNNENGLSGIRLTIEPGNFVEQTNDLGYWYKDSLPIGTYTVTVDTTNSNWIPTCPIFQTFTVINPDSSVSAPDFGFISAYPCPTPDVNIVMPIMRRGFANQRIYVQACNENTATGILDSAYTIVELPSSITVQSATLAYTALGANRFRFNLGAINPGQCINFSISATVTTQVVANQTLCMSAELFPQADCVFDSIPTPYPNNPSGTVSPCTLPWDRSSLRVEGECIGDSVRFVIYNTGSFGGGDMDCFAPVRVYLDGQWVMLDSIRIVGGDSVVFMFAGTGGTIRLEADQHPLHPGNSHPNANVENCGNGTWTPGIINIMPQNDADPVIDIFCGQVTAPTDPNDKTGFPLGVGTNHNIRQNQQIEYLVRFQNIGTDTAVNVVIRDTLTTDLNIFTVQSGVASHPYEFRMYGPRILEWKFNNIMLPDSNVNEPASNGFVKFTVEQNPDLPFGTVIENSAAIYFDFEAPVITNTYFHTISDFSIQVSTEKLEGPLTKAIVSVIPNPFKESAIVKVEGIENSENLELEIFSLSGQRIQYLNNSQNGQFELSRGEMGQGIYLFCIIQNGKVVARGKMVVQ